MSWVSSFCGVIGSAVSSVVSGIKNTISTAVSWIKEKIFKLGDKKSYDPKNATLEETRQINELLEICIRGYSREAEKYDRAAAEIMEAQFKQLRNKLKEINAIGKEKIIEDYIFRSFEDNLTSIKKNLDKVYSKQIANVFSLNNRELLSILELEPGKEKNNKLKRLALDTIIEANDKLMEELEEFIFNQQKFISERLSEYIENIKRALITAEKETQKIIELKSGDENSFEALKEKYNNLKGTLELVNEILERKE